MKPFRVLLLPVSFFYWLVVTVRNWLFDKGILSVTTLDVPVVSVGNISAGGTGKTPFVEFLVGKLKSMGWVPGVVSRGYGRSSKGYLVVSSRGARTVSVEEAGDEPFQMAERLGDTTIVVDENRVEASQRMLTETSTDCIVLDDGFQHRYLARDLDIVLLTAKEIRHRQWLLPAGNRRESERSLQRAGLIVISKCDSVQEYKNCVETLADWKSKPIAGFRIEPTTLRSVKTGACIGRMSAENIPVLIFSGIGDPESFKRSVEEFGCTVAKAIEFSDHHWYSSADIEVIWKEFGAQGAQMVVTTEKDAARLRSMREWDGKLSQQLPLYALEIVPKFISGETIVDKMIAEVKQ